MSKTKAFHLLSLAFIVFVIGPYVIVAQNALTGEWTANAKEDSPDKIQLSFEFRREGGGRNQHGSSFSYSDLRGLSPAQTENGKVNFSLAREAGTIDCEGSFSGGRGSGTFRFTPNYAFADAMRSRGFDFSKSGKNGRPNDLEMRLFTATTLNVTTAFADDLKSANFGPLDVDDLFKAVIFQITPQFMSEMKSTGFPDLGMEELVKARIFKVDADYVRQVNSMGYPGLDFESLVKFRIFKVEPEFLSALKAEGLTNIDAEDIVKFRIFKIDPAFVREAKAAEPNITADQLVEMKIGVRRRTK